MDAAGDTSDVTLTGLGTTTVNVDYTGSGIHRASEIPFTLTTAAPATSMTGTVVRPDANAGFGIYLRGDDCDEDGVTATAGDADDFDACVQTAADVAVAGAVNLIPGGLAGGGTLNDLDCDADGTTAGADGADTDPCVDPTTAPAGNDCDADGTTVGGGDGDDTDPCVDPADLTQPATGSDCDGDGTAVPTDSDDSDGCVDFTAAPASNDCDGDGNTVGGGDGDDSNPCIDPADLTQPATGTDCDSDGTAVPADTDDSDNCVDPANPAAPGVGTDCDGDGTATPADTDDSDPCVDQANVNQPATGSDCDMDGAVVPADTDDADPCIDPAVPQQPATGSDCDLDGTVVPTDIDDDDPCVMPANLQQPAAGTDCDGDGTTVPLDDDDSNPCIDATIPPTTNDCDGDQETAATDPDDFDRCVVSTNAVYNTPGSAPGVAPDCDGDGLQGVEGTNEDPNDEDPCDPVPCSDAGVILSSMDQSISAMRALQSTEDHIAYRLGLLGRGVQPVAVTLNANGGEVSVTGSDVWGGFTVTGISRSDALSGKGLFASGTVGWDLLTREDRLAGVTVGAEYGEWDYEDETDVTKTGVSLGVYGGQRLGAAGLVTGTLTITRFVNELTHTDFGIAEVDSRRIMTSLGYSQQFGSGIGTVYRPYINATYAFEELPEYQYSEAFTPIPESEAEVGEVSLGLEMQSLQDGGGSMFARFEASQAFGTGEVELSDGTIITPFDEVTGSVSLGVSRPAGATTSSVEVSVNDIGNDAREEVTVDAQWERAR